MKTKKNEKKYTCEACDYSTSKKTDYARHILTRKHEIRTFSNDFTKKNDKALFICEGCNKQYKARSSLWYHKKRCEGLINKNANSNTNSLENFDEKKISIFSQKKKNIFDNEKEKNENEIYEKYTNLNSLNNVDENEEKNFSQKNFFEKNENENIKNENENDENENLSTKELLIKLLKENINLTTKISEQAEKNAKVNNYNYNNIGNVNINIFLNETCKDAINMSEFTKNLTIGMYELEMIKRNGLINGISSVLLNNLKQLELSKRPIHCTDVKNKVLYVKEENEWEKDTGVVKKTINSLRDKHITALKSWEADNPNWNDDPDLTEQYLQMTSETTNELGETDKNEIIETISKHVEIKNDQTENS